MDLFATPDLAGRLERFGRTFERWIAHRQAAPISASRNARALREDSAAVYRDMWTAFGDWCARHECELATIDAGDLEAFLMSLGGTQATTLRYRRRMLQLIRRVDAFDAREDGRRVNAAIAELAQGPSYRFAESESEDPLPEFLTAGEARRLIASVTERQRSPSAHEAWTWKTVRDRTAVALQLGAGITPGEVRGLTLGQIIVAGGPVKDEPWALSLPGNGNFPARQTPLARWAARQLVEWLRVRAEQAIPGEQVFPSTRTGKAWSKDSGYLAFRDVLAQAGFVDAAGGTFKLRHTFALRQLTRYPPDQVAAWLGVQPEAMQRYRRVLAQPVEVV